MQSRVFGVMPHQFSFLPMAMKKAEELGYTAVQAGIAPTGGGT